MSAYLLSCEALSNLAWEFVRLNADFLKFVRRKPIFRAFSKPWQVAQDSEEATLQKVFQVLLAENLRALKARYGSRSAQDHSRARQWKFVAPSAEYKKMPFDASAVVELCAVYNSQALEDGNYHRTLAASIIANITERSLRTLASESGYPIGWRGPLDKYA